MPHKVTSIPVFTGFSLGDRGVGDDAVIGYDDDFNGNDFSMTVRIKDVAAAAHKLKGASANIHANRLRDLSFELESRAGQMDQAQIKALLVTLNEEFKRAGEFLQAQTPGAVSKVG